MKIIIVRHGETKEGKKGIILGQLPGNLSVQGKLEVKKIALAIKKSDLNPSLIISSDLKRTKETAKIISKKLNLPIVYERLIRERHVGIAQGKKEDQIDWEIYEKKPFLQRKHKGGESFLILQKRAKKFFSKMKKCDKDVIVISHSAFILMLISVIYKIPFQELIKYKNKTFFVEIKKGRLRLKPSFMKI